MFTNKLYTWTNKSLQWEYIDVIFGIVIILITLLSSKIHTAMINNINREIRLSILTFIPVQLTKKCETIILEVNYLIHLFIILSLFVIFSVKRGCRLWEYIRNLLLDPRTNPSLIKWEDRKEGTFKLVQNKKIAFDWGWKKGNSDMSYEKLSRAMRYIAILYM
jgi:hypothetical protein